MRNSARHTIALVAIALVAAGCGSDKKSKASEGSTTAAPATTTQAQQPVVAPTRSKPKVKVPTGPAPKKLVVKDLIKGTGPVANAGDPLTMNYVGVLYKNGKQFDASYDRGQPFPFQLGGGQVIPGWDKGIVGMRVGGRRELIIPPSDGYGAAGSPPTIPPNATLVFVVDLQSIG